MLWFNVIWGVLLGGAFVAAGIRLWNRKPAVLAPRTLTIALGVLFVPALVVAGFGCAAALREGETRLLLPMLFPLLMVVLTLVFFRQIIGRAIVLNVNETTLYDALENVLDRHGMSYREQRSTIDVEEVDAKIEVNYQATTNSGTVNATGGDQKELFPVLEDLRAALRDKPIDRRSRIAPWYVALGALMMVSQVGLISLRAAAG